LRGGIELASREGMTLGPKDKTLASHRFGYNFHHTSPQRRLPCILGDMLVPASADDIAPISADAMRSVEDGLTLLQQLLGDRDHNLFLACNEMTIARAAEEAAAVGRVTKALRAILRVTAR
jgi:hypothetical protein